MIESEHGTVDIDKYNESLKREPERDELRVRNTAPNLHARQQQRLHEMGMQISEDGHRLVPRETWRGPFKNGDIARITITHEEH